MTTLDDEPDALHPELHAALLRTYAVSPPDGLLHQLLQSTSLTMEASPSRRITLFLAVIFIGAASPLAGWLFAPMHSLWLVVWQTLGLLLHASGTHAGTSSSSKTVILAMLAVFAGASVYMANRLSRLTR